ncbi:hypothetical protein [Streptomyces aureocirculatus]|uniref:hypothetical protein n=1 Tax=Streptomyces aureocirculatus TaxID=67275 RepID=UPI0004C7F55A|nr:hypothetical protein [Streptomyces aureocirculatus]
MRRGLVHAVAWSLATGAAVTLSWWGVHTVMAGTAYDPPRAVPLAAGDRATDPQSSSTHRPGPGPGGKPSKDRGPAGSSSPATKAPDGEKDGKHPPAEHSDARSDEPGGRSSSGPAHPRSPGSGSSDGVKGYTTDGGRVVLDLGASSATLVSASPSAGWSMRVWKASRWIRVEFASGADRVSVFCTWHDHAPRVDINTY